MLPSQPLGETGIAVTAVGLGLAAIGRPAYITLGRDRDLGGERGAVELERRCHEVLDAAYAAGIRYVDAARSYGRAEEFLASWLAARRMDPGAVAVGSKWGYRYVGDWRMDAEVNEVKDHSAAALDRQLTESRALLGDHLRLYQIHSATLDTGVLDDPEVLARLLALADQGLVIGLSTSGPAQATTLRRAMAAELDGENPFRCVQATWNLLEPSVGSALGEAHAAGWGVIVKEVVANGRLAPGSTLGVTSDLAMVARRHGVEIDAVAIAAALAQPWADVVLSGAATVGQLEDNLHALRVELDGDELDRFGMLAEPAPEYWQTRNELPWH